MKKCEYCGANVVGEVCEYCGMNINSAPQKIVYKPKKNMNIIPVIICITGLILMVVMSAIHKTRQNINNEITLNNMIPPAIEYNERSTRDMPVYDSNQAFKENGVFPSGTYQIGVDIPEGIYIFMPDLADGHGVEGVYSDPECNNQISSAYVHFDGSRIAEISGYGYVKFSWATAYDLDKHPEIVNDPYESEGTFIVGRDIEPGTYHLKAYGEYPEYAEWYIYSSINSTGMVLKNSGVLADSDGFCENVTDEITLKDGEFLELKSCVIAKD